MSIEMYYIYGSCLLLWRLNSIKFTIYRFFIFWSSMHINTFLSFFLGVKKNCKSNLKMACTIIINKIKIIFLYHLNSTTLVQLFRRPFKNNIFDYRRGLRVNRKISLILTSVVDSSWLIIYDFSNSSHII